jgi:mannosyltransferase OCH1-like enzyme
MDILMILTIKVSKYILSEWHSLKVFYIVVLLTDTIGERMTLQYNGMLKYKIIMEFIPQQSSILTADNWRFFVLSGTLFSVCAFRRGIK